MQVNQFCRICKSKNLKLAIDLDTQPLANAFLKKEQLNDSENFYPLRVFFCQDCNLCQLIDIVPKETLFRDYVYFSSAMPVLPQHFKDYADYIYDNFISSNKDLVVEIGSNDGLLLSAFKSKGVKVLGVDPAINIAKVANERGIETLPEFFTSSLVEKITKKYGRAKVIIGNNVVAHINDHHDLVKGISALLSDEGVFVFEAPYLIDMLENYTFDTIYHEHMSYLAVRPLLKLFDKYEMEIFDVKTYPVQGNSLRGFVGKKGKHRIQKSVREFVKKEKEYKLDSWQTYIKLAREISYMKERLVKLLEQLKAEGKTIAGYGAPAKGNTLLNYYKIGADTLDFVTEGLKSKVGTYTPGTHIPVVDIEWARNNPPDYYLLLAWNYKDAILEKEKEYLKSGGKFIMPVGNIEIYG